ncbi:unnamed protein product, partial [Protopolystoma xenopodis]
MRAGHQRSRPDELVWPAKPLFNGFAYRAPLLYVFTEIGLAVFHVPSAAWVASLACRRLRPLARDAHLCLMQPTSSVATATNSITTTMGATSGVSAHSFNIIPPASLFSATERLTTGLTNGTGFNAASGSQGSLVSTNHQDGSSVSSASSTSSCSIASFAPHSAPPIPHPSRFPAPGAANNGGSGSIDLDSSSPAPRLTNTWSSLHNTPIYLAGLSINSGGCNSVGAIGGIRLVYLPDLPIHFDTSSPVAPPAASTTVANESGVPVFGTSGLHGSISRIRSRNLELPIVQPAHAVRNR